MNKGNFRNWIQAAFVLSVMTASEAARAALYDGRTHAMTSIEQISGLVRPGEIWIISEFHDQKAHHDHQMQALNAFSKMGIPLSVGFEFYEVGDQAIVDQFVAGGISEPDFLKAIHWGSLPFDFYREQTLFPKVTRGYTLALNAPRSLTARISKVGIDGLNDQEKAVLPKDFTLGNPSYRERFAHVMGEHVPASALNRYFEAQSTWDEFMATSAIGFLRSHPEQALVIIVGDFHVEFGGGLPDRLRSRSLIPVHVISQVIEESESLPDPKYGSRAEFVWTVK